MRSVTFEQGYQLATALLNAGVEHGDTARVEIEGPGVLATQSNIHIPFCPMVRLQVIGDIQRGTPAERAKPMPQQVTVSETARKQLCQSVPRHTKGFLQRCVLTVHSNGTIHCEELEEAIFRPAPRHQSFHGRDSYRSFIGASA